MATVVLLQGRIPVVCGGQQDKYCFALIDNSWVQEPDLSTTRRGPCSFAFNDNEWMVTGGSGVGSDILSLDQQFRPGPDLPVAIHAGCAVKINATTGLVMGGQQINTYYFNIDKEEWHLGPPLGKTRTSQACGLIEDLADRSIHYVIFAGGRMKATDILQIGADEWEQGPEFPNSQNWGSHMTAAPDGKTLYLSGGSYNGRRNNLIYRIRCTNGFVDGCQWERMGFELAYARDWHTSVFLPESLYPCHPTTSTTLISPPPTTTKSTPEPDPCCNNVPGGCDCQANWENIASGYYWFVNEALTKDLAKASCEQVDAKLYEPTDSDINYAVPARYYDLYGTSQPGIWLGIIKDPGSEGR